MAGGGGGGGMWRGGGRSNYVMQYSRMAQYIFSIRKQHTVNKGTRV